MLALLLVMTVYYIFELVKWHYWVIELMVPLCQQHYLEPAVQRVAFFERFGGNACVRNYADERILVYGLIVCGSALSFASYKAY